MPIHPALISYLTQPPYNAIFIIENKWQNYRRDSQWKEDTQILNRE